MDQITLASTTNSSFNNNNNNNSDWIVNVFIPLVKEWRIFCIEELKRRPDLIAKKGFKITIWLDEMKKFIINNIDNKEIYLFVKYLVNYKALPEFNYFKKCEYGEYCKCCINTDQLLYIVRENLKQIYIAAGYRSVLNQTAKFMNFDTLVNENFWKSAHLSPSEFRFVDIEIGLYLIREVIESSNGNRRK